MVSYSKTLSLSRLLLYYYHRFFIIKTLPVFYCCCCIKANRSNSYHSIFSLLSLLLTFVRSFKRGHLDKSFLRELVSSLGVALVAKSFIKKKTKMEVLKQCMLKPATRNMLFTLNRQFSLSNANNVSLIHLHHDIDRL